MKQVLDWNTYLQLAADAVSEGIVMLRNENRALPLPAGEQIALHLMDEIAGLAHVFGLSGQQTDMSVQLVQCAVTLEALTAFAYALAAHEGGLASVTRFGVDVHSVLLLFVRKGTTFF